MPSQHLNVLSFVLVVSGSACMPVSGRLAAEAQPATHRRDRLWSRRLLVNGNGVAVRIGEGERQAEGAGSGIGQDCCS